MTLVLVKSVKHGKLITLGAECDDHFIKWHSMLEDLEDKWDEMLGLEIEGRLDDAKLAAIESNSIHAKAVEQWFRFVKARQKFVVFEESLSGWYPTTELREKL